MTVALSTRADRRFVTFEGSIGGFRPESDGRFHACVPDTSISRSFPGRAAVGGVSGQRLAAPRMTTSWDFGWDDRLANDPQLWSLATSVDLLFINAHEARLYARGRNLHSALARWRAAPNHIVDQARRRGKPSRRRRRRRAARRRPAYVASSTPPALAMRSMLAFSLRCSAGVRSRRPSRSATESARSRRDGPAGIAGLPRFGGLS